MTVERQPLEMMAAPATQPAEFFVNWVRLASKQGISVRVDDPDLAVPSVDGWFAIGISFRQSDVGVNNADTLITNGDEFYLGRRRNGKSPFVLTPTTRQIIFKTLTEFQL